MRPVMLVWNLGVALLLVLAPASRAAVNGDGQPPCWRGQTGTTRQTWRFDTGASPLAPEIATNPTGSPSATISPNVNGVGWIDTTCAWLEIGCDPGNGDVDPFGTAQGYWDLGGTNVLSSQPGTVLLTIPALAAAGATRYVWVQATVWIESGIAAYPAYVISSAFQVGGAVNLLMENPTNSDGSLASGAWYNQQTLWSLPATGAVTTVQLRAAGVGTILDTVGVDTMQRSGAAADTAVTPQNVATNLSGANLLANDGGPALSLVGVSTPGSAGGTVSVVGGNVIYAPPENYIGADTFYYTNSDCAGNLAVGQVSVDVVPDPASTPPSIVSIRGSNGDVVVTFQGVPGLMYRVEAASNLPAAGWITLSTNLAATDPTTNGDDVLLAGQWRYRDTNALLSHPSRFYRSVRP